MSEVLSEYLACEKENEKLRVELARAGETIARLRAEKAHLEMSLALARNGEHKVTQELK